MAATDPAELLTQAADAITLSARVVEAAVELRKAPRGKRGPLYLAFCAAVDALLAAREGR